MKAFVLRIAPGGKDCVPEALASNQIIIGWAEAKGLLDPKLSWDDFRRLLGNAYYSGEPNLRKAGSAAGHMWRFTREMSPGDLVVVPYGSGFYVAEVAGPALYDSAKQADDTAYRRDVIWRNEKHSVPRAFARSALISRMKIQGTCAYATDLLGQIEECLDHAKSGHTPTFKGDLQTQLVNKTLEVMRSGFIENFGFENLIKEVLVGLGAVEARIIPRNLDKGADIVATFRVAGAISQRVAVQAKHWLPTLGPVGADVVKQLIKGIEAEDADLGMVVTSGTIAEEAVKAASEYYDDKGVRIELLNGEDLAKLMVESGVRTS